MKSTTRDGSTAHLADEVSDAPLKLLRRICDIEYGEVTKMGDGQHRPRTRQMPNQCSRNRRLGEPAKGYEIAVIQERAG